MSRSLREVIKSFKCEDDENPVSDVKAQVFAKIAKRSPVKKTQAHGKIGLTLDAKSTSILKDLPSSISTNLSVVFVGYNPGVESSRQQHHYAHPTNLFWKLFNASDILSAILDMRSVEYSVHQALLGEAFQNGKSVARPEHDFRLVDMGIGFTDLVLRCTKQASQLSNEEKAENVPRLFSEFQMSQAPFVVFIGKGIWEVVCKYLVPKHKLTATNFTWGVQRDPSILTRFHTFCSNKPKVYVFPNTSGLVTSMNFAEKLRLWESLVADFQSSTEG